MNAAAGTSEAVQYEAATAVQLRRATFEDYAQIVWLERTALDRSAASITEWRRLWVDNPLWREVGGNWPIGWVLQTADGRIVGSFGNIPLLYYFRGERVVAATGRGWIVLPQYRGFALWLLDERFRQSGVDLFIDTTISHNSLAAFSEFSNRVPLGDWHTIAFCVTGHRSFARRALEKLNVPLSSVLSAPLGASLWIKDAILRPKLGGSPYTIEVPERFDSRFEIFWNELLRQSSETLLAARDTETLTWHFSTALNCRRLGVFIASRNGKMRAYAIFRRQGGAKTAQRARLVDYQTLEPEKDALRYLLDAAWRWCVAEDIYILDKAGVGIAKTQAFDRFGTYRQRRPWPFFYRAVAPALAYELRKPSAWDPSDYDGDATIE